MCMSNYYFKMRKIFLICKETCYLCDSGHNMPFHHRCMFTLGQCKSFSLWLSKSSSYRVSSGLFLMNSRNLNILGSYVHMLRDKVNFNCLSSSSFKRLGNRPYLAVFCLRHSINLDVHSNFGIHTCLHHPSFWNSSLYGHYNKNTEIYLRT